jgi:hypothetical protein
VASGDITIGPLLWWYFRRIALLAPQRAKGAVQFLRELRIRIAG